MAKMIDVNFLPDNAPVKVRIVPDEVLTKKVEIAFLPGDNGPISIKALRAGESMVVDSSAEISFPVVLENEVVYATGQVLRV